MLFSPSLSCVLISEIMESLPYQCPQLILATPGVQATSSYFSLSAVSSLISQTSALR